MRFDEVFAAVPTTVPTTVPTRSLHGPYGPYKNTRHSSIPSASAKLSSGLSKRNDGWYAGGCENWREMCMDVGVAETLVFL